MSPEPVMNADPPMRSRAWHLRRSMWRDARNLARFGFNAPRWSQRIWFDPASCTTFVSTHNRSYTGQVLDGDWDVAPTPLEEHIKISACKAHWTNGLTWEETGVIDHVMGEIGVRGSKDGCTTLEEVIRRYRQLDMIYEQVKRERRIRTRSEIEPRAFREAGGIYIHINRDNRTVFGDGGCHRLALAQVLEIPEIPAQLGVVHPNALPVWKAMFERD